MRRHSSRHRIAALVAAVSVAVPLATWLYAVTALSNCFWFCHAQPRCWIQLVTIVPTTPVRTKPMMAMNAFCRQDSSVLGGAGAVEEDKGDSAMVDAGVAAGVC